MKSLKFSPGDLTWDDEYTVQHTHDVLQNCTLERYVILLTKVTPINSIKAFLKSKITTH